MLEQIISVVEERGLERPVQALAIVGAVAVGVMAVRGARAVVRNFKEEEGC